MAHLNHKSDDFMGIFVGQTIKNLEFTVWQNFTRILLCTVPFMVDMPLN
jgi:hypothetical protein